MAWERVITAFFAGLAPVLPQLSLVVLAVLVLTFRIPGRGPRFFQRADPWRRFKGEPRRAVMDRAGGRCEGAIFLAWGRCSERATEVDHVYPHSRGGPTTLANGQALCRSHNRRKGAMRPPWWYLLSLERRRRAYFPSGTDVRVTATITDAELTEHANALSRSLSR